MTIEPPRRGVAEDRLNLESTKPQRNAEPGRTLRAASSGQATFPTDFVTSCLRGSIAFPPRLRVSAVRILATLLLSTVALAQPVWACPNCKDSLAQQGENGPNVARGFYWSILFMMGTPFAILGAFSGYMYLEVRKARRAAELMNAPPRRGGAEEEQEAYSSR